MLSLPWPHALGLAGLLWRFTAKHAPTGEIGRHDDEEIASALEWPGDESDLIESLVRCRLLDAADLPVRLLVHDWPDHAPRYVLATLRRKGLAFSVLYKLQADGSTGQSTDQSTDLSARRSGQPAVVTTYTSTSTLTNTHTNTKEEKPKSVDAALISVEVDAGHDSDEDADQAVPLVESITPITKSSNRLDSVSRTASTVPETMISTIWSLWIPGRKKAKKVGHEKIHESIVKLAKANQCSIREAALFIARQTKIDADNYRSEIEQGQNELKFVPLATTYFNQERWNDSDDKPNIEQVRKDRITSDLERARSKMG